MQGQREPIHDMRRCEDEGDGIYMDEGTPEEVKEKKRIRALEEFQKLGEETMGAIEEYEAELIDGNENGYYELPEELADDMEEHEDLLWKRWNENVGTKIYEDVKKLGDL